MLKSDKYARRVLSALGARGEGRETEIRAFFSSVDAAVDAKAALDKANAGTDDNLKKTKRTDFEAACKPAGVEEFLTALDPFSGDDTIDSREAASLAKLVPEELKNPTMLRRAAPDRKSWIYMLLIAVLLGGIYFAFLHGEATQASKDAAAVERARIATEGYNAVVEANSFFRQAVEAYRAGKDSEGDELVKKALDAERRAMEITGTSSE